MEPSPPTPLATLSSPCPVVGAPELEVSSLLTPGTQTPRLQAAPPLGPGRQAERLASEGLGQPVLGPWREAAGDSVRLMKDFLNVRLDRTEECGLWGQVDPSSNSGFAT